jgi:thiol-disulfide isomerase/thioredoxin
MAQITMLVDREEVLHHIQKVQESFHIKAPDLPTNYCWLNVAHPLTAKELSGKVILLDFWTYCCVNCLHSLPDLKYLEQKYAGRPLVVIGVHSAKFPNEQHTENIRQAILRNGIGHPVIVDQNFSLWQAYAIHAWPTFVLIDPDGNIETVVSGEPNRDTLDLYIEVLLEQYEILGRLNHHPVAAKLEKEQKSDSDLHYPGKIIADPDRKWLFIADTGHHQILATDLSGKVLHTIGNGGPGFEDGPFTTAQLSGPQGLALYKDTLLVADTGNHVVRQIDFISRQIRTIAGTGEQGRYYFRTGPGLEIPLNSPWDLQVVGDTCYIAMAGAHQIWTLDLSTSHLESYAGTSREGRIDGPRKKSAFAQPSGITADPEGRFLFVADSEISCVRMLDLQRSGDVTTLVGGDVFDFGDEDGYGESVRLQHPLGLVYAEGKLYLADTYNHKIKTINPQSRIARSYLGTGQAGFKDGLAPQFYEPGGLTALAGCLYIADTNNHQIRVVNLHTHEVRTVLIQNDRTAQPGTVTRNEMLPIDTIIQEKPSPVCANGFILRVNLQLPPDRQFTPAAAFRYLLIGKESVFSAPSLNQIHSPGKPVRQFEIPVKILAAEGPQELRLQLQYFYCDKSPAGTCKMRTVEHQIPIEIHHTAQTEITIQDSPK